MAIVRDLGWGRGRGGSGSHGRHGVQSFLLFFGINFDNLKRYSPPGLCRETDGYERMRKRGKEDKPRHQRGELIRRQGTVNGLGSCEGYKDIIMRRGRERYFMESGLLRSLGVGSSQGHNNNFDYDYNSPRPRLQSLMSL